MTQPEVYISIDVETDGPIPGPHSMLSLGAAAYVEREGQGVLVSTFSENLLELHDAAMHPATKSEFWDKNPEAWAACRKDCVTPSFALARFVQWVNRYGVEEGRKAVCVAYPAGFDWTWVYWYLIKFGFESPFGFQCLDIKSYASATLALPFRETTKKVFPAHWQSEQPHTHVAVEDAVEQGALFMAMMIERSGQDREKAALENRFAQLRSDLADICAAYCQLVHEFKQPGMNFPLYRPYREGEKRYRIPLAEWRCSNCRVGRIVQGVTPEVRTGTKLFATLDDRELRYDCACMAADDITIPIVPEEWRPIEGEAATKRFQFDSRYMEILFTKGVP